MIVDASALLAIVFQESGYMTAGHYSDGGITRQMVATPMSGQFVVDMVHIIFEEVAFNVFPGLSPIYRRLEGLTASPPRLSGAGPALFCLPASPEDFSRVSEALPTHQGRAYLVQTITPTVAEVTASKDRIPGAYTRSSTESSN